MNAATSGDGGIVSNVTKVAASLPAQFLALVLLNIVFIVGLLWYEMQLNDKRSSVLTAIIERCLDGGRNAITK